MRWFKHMTASADDELYMVLGQFDELIAKKRLLLDAGVDVAEINFEIMTLREIIRNLEENTVEQRWMQ